MKQLFFKAKKAGLPPGTLIYSGEEKTYKPKISLIDYNETNFQESEIENIEESFPFKDTPTITWINIDGVHDTGMIEKLGNKGGGFIAGYCGGSEVIGVPPETQEIACKALVKYGWYNGRYKGRAW